MELQQLTMSVCRVAREAGAYINKERASFSLDKVERKHAHDYVSYVDKGSEQPRLMPLGYGMSQMPRTTMIRNPIPLSSMLGRNTAAEPLPHQVPSRKTKLSTII
jgi:hypothetical protein